MTEYLTIHIWLSRKTLLIFILCMKEKNSELMMSIQLILSKNGSGELTTRCILNKLLNSWKKGYVHFPNQYFWHSALLTWKDTRKTYLFQSCALEFWTKGLLISKCPFGVIVWTKIATKILSGFLPWNFYSFLGAS